MTFLIPLQYCFRTALQYAYGQEKFQDTASVYRTDIQDWMHVNAILNEQ